MQFCISVTHIYSFCPQFKGNSFWDKMYLSKRSRIPQWMVWIQCVLQFGEEKSLLNQRVTVTPMTSHKIPSIPAAGFPTPAPYHQIQPCSRLTLPPASPKCVDSWPLTPKYPPQKIIKIWESNSQLYFIKDQIVDQWNGLKSLL